MNRKKIHYICNFDNQDSGYSLNTQASTNSKASYILHSLVEAGFNVSIHSTAIGKTSVKNKVLFYDNYSIEYLYSIGRKSIIHKILSNILICVQLVNVWYKNPKNEPFLLYHSLLTTKIFNILRKLSHRHMMFIEIEEVYSVVYCLSSKKIKSEIKMFSKYDGYILVNENIGRLCNINNKSIVCHGIYLPNSLETKFMNGGRTIILYAGALNKDMNLAVDVAKLLPSNYHLFILGYGSEDQIINLKKIEEETQKTDCASVEYCGCLFGEEYNSFLNKCNIGLCTRVVDGDESLYAFPSKILAYLSNNLLTISTPLTSIKNSKLKSMVYFSTDFSAKSIADAIMIDTKKNTTINYSEELMKYHEQFISQLRTFFS